jgi:hypothetical protein
MALTDRCSRRTGGVAMIQVNSGNGWLPAPEWDSKVLRLQEQ